MGIKYSATYNNVTRDVTDASGSSFVLKYGGKDSGGSDHIIQQETISAGGGKTLSCSGKLMIGDVKVGSIKTISCGGKKAASDIVVASQSYTVYTWKKYNTVATKAWTTTKVKSNVETKYISSGAHACYAANAAELTSAINVSDGLIHWQKEKARSNNDPFLTTDYYSAHDDNVINQNTNTSGLLWTSSKYAVCTDVGWYLLGWVTLKYDVYQISNVHYDYSAGSYISDVTSTDQNGHSVHS